MNKQQFIKRCETAWDMGLINEFRLGMIEKWLDFVMKLDLTLFGGGETHGECVFDFLESERKRLRKNGFSSDEDLNASIQFSAVLSHPCQKCGEDKNAFHTRRWFCPHLNKKLKLSKGRQS